MDDQRTNREGGAGMTPEEEIQKMFSTPEEAKPTYCRRCNEHITGPMLIGDEGEVR